MNPRILIIDNSTKPESYRPVEHWAPFLLFPYDAFYAPANEFPADLNPYSHIILTGSDATILDTAQWTRAEEDLVRTAIDLGKVILGSCYGHQLIARALFGPSSVRRMPGPEAGWPRIRIIHGDSLMGAAGSSVYSFAWHFDEVCRLPDDKAKILAQSDGCRIQAFKLTDHPVWGLQPHPEIGIAEGLKCFGAYTGSDGPRREELIKSQAFQPRDSGWVVPILRAFQYTAPGSPG
jgi:GMP synthase-like glutamine amidotransferase